MQNMEERCVKYLGQREDLVSIDEAGITIFGAVLYNQWAGQVVRLHRQTQTVWVFDIGNNTYFSFEGYTSVRLNRNMKLMGLRGDGSEEILLAAR